VNFDFEIIMLKSKYLFLNTIIILKA